MILRCGYIMTVDRDDNKNDKITVISFEGSNVYNCDKRLFSKYVFTVCDYKLVEKYENGFSDIGYMKLLELVDKCLDVDRKNKFYRKYVFNFDSNKSPCIYEKEIIKDVFPVPSKNISYMRKNCYCNITEIVFGKQITTELAVSAATEHLNNIAVQNGYIYDRMFEYSFGRLFINTTLFTNSFEGRNLLKRILPGYKNVIEFDGNRIKHIKLRKYPQAQSEFINNKYTNEYLNYHCSTANILKGKNIFDLLVNVDEFSRSVDEEIVNIENYFSKIYHIYNGATPKDLKYLSVEDILKIHTDADFSYNITSYISDKRKIYNANKHKNIFCIKSDGSLYCIP